MDPLPDLHALREKLKQHSALGTHNVGHYQELTPAQVRMLAPSLLAKEYFERKRRVLEDFENRYAEMKRGHQAEREVIEAPSLDEIVAGFSIDEPDELVDES
jgi:hypothetical protein